MLLVVCYMYTFPYSYCFKRTIEIVRINYTHPLSTPVIYVVFTCSISNVFIVLFKFFWFSLVEPILV